MALVKNLFLLLVLTCLITYSTASRGFPTKPGCNLTSRLEASGGLVECWNALLELKSCTNEIALYFLNGQTSIGPDCCRAIGIITHSCWAANAMLTSLGFTAEEGNILRGYCDASSPGPIAASPIVGPPVSG